MLDNAFTWFLVSYKEEFRRGKPVAFETLLSLSLSHLFGYYNPKDVAFAHFFEQNRDCFLLRENALSFVPTRANAM